MPQRWYFLIGDLIANAAAGVLAALLCYWLIDTSWPMFIAMLVAMLLGMLVAFVLDLLVLMRYFGAMEVMLPTMLSGMWAGMIVGMRASMAPLSAADAVIFGLLTGITVIALCWAINGRMEGKQHDY